MRSLWMLEELGLPYENVKALGDLSSDFDFSQTPRPPVLLPVHPKTTLTGTPRPRGRSAAALAANGDG